MAVRDIIVAVVQDVAADQNRKLQRLTDDLPLLESGLDSLCMAVIVVRLERELGTDPFSTDAAIAMPVTFGDLVELYAGALV